MAVLLAVNETFLSAKVPMDREEEVLGIVQITIADFGDSIELSIADKGMGISQGDLDKIFERFYTVDKARSRRMGGAGLGLSIVNAIVGKHDAEISVSSSVGKGTTFKLTFQPSMVLSL